MIILILHFTEPLNIVASIRTSPENNQKALQIKRLLQKALEVKVKSDLLSCVKFFVIPWTVASQLLCPWDSPGKNTGMGSHFLLQRIFPTQELNMSLPHCRQILYCLSHEGSKRYLELQIYCFCHVVQQQQKEKYSRDQQRSSNQ